VSDKNRKPNGYWTKGRCQEVASKFETRNEFQRGSCSAYASAKRKGWLDEICSHMIELKKPRGYWTKERCEEVASKFETRNDFQNGCKGAYLTAIKKGWLDEICSHMKANKIKHMGYWTKERCHEEASKYNTRSEFRKGSCSAYNISGKNGWLDEICTHMIELKKPNGYWTKERCHEEASKYNTRNEFEKGCRGAYKSAIRKSWLNDICSHMSGYTPKGYWTFERCKEEASTYETRNDFRKGSYSAYIKAHSKDWLDKICSHMTPQGNLKKRYIYAFEFPKYNSVYVGLTWSLEERFYAHTNREGGVYNFIQENNLSENDFIFKEYGYYEEKESTVKEGEKEIEYKDKGWNILNKAKTGGLGGGKIKWTKEICHEEALKYETRTEFSKAVNGAYNRAKKNAWLDEICYHMSGYKPKGYWNVFDNVKEEALKYNTRGEFQKGSCSAYNASLRNGWLDKVLPKVK